MRQAEYEQQAWQNGALSDVVIHLQQLEGIVGRVHSCVTFEGDDVKGILYDDCLVTLSEAVKFELCDPIGSFPVLAQQYNQYKRPLLYFSLEQASSEVLVCEGTEVHADFQKRGVGSNFQHAMHEYARARGLSFVCGWHNDADTARFYLQSGRYFLQEVQEQYRHLLAPVVRSASGVGDVFYTVYFLNPEDATRMLTPDALSSTLEYRLRHREHTLKLAEMLRIMQVKFQAWHPEYRNRHSYAYILSLIAILDEISLFLPETERGMDLGYVTMKALETSAEQVLAQCFAALKYLGGRIDQLVAGDSDEYVFTLLQEFPELSNE